MVRVPSKFPVETRTELAEYEDLERHERIVACYLHLWRAEGWRPTAADVAVCAGVSKTDTNRHLKRAATEHNAIIFPDTSIPSGSIPRGLQMSTDRAAAMVTLIITNLTPTYVHGALLSGPEGPAFPTHAISQESFTRYVLQNIAPLPFEYDARRKDRMYRHAESCVALIRETANMLHTSPPAPVPAAVQSWLLRYDTFMSGGTQSSAAATPTPTLASHASPATATASLASSSSSVAASGGGGEAAAGGGLTIGASLEASLPASPLAVGPTSTIAAAAAAASDGGGAASSSTSTSARYTYTPSELSTRSVNRNAFVAMLVPYASIKRVRAEDSPPPCSPTCTMHARASAGKIPNAELVSHMMKTKCRITSTEKLQTAMSVPMPTDLYFLKSGVGQTTYVRKSPKKETTKLQLRQTETAPPPPQQQPQPAPASVTPRKRTFSQSLQDLSNEASSPGNSQPKRAAKGSEQ